MVVQRECHLLMIRLWHMDAHVRARMGISTILPVMNMDTDMDMDGVTPFLYGRGCRVLTGAFVKGIRVRVFRLGLGIVALTEIRLDSGMGMDLDLCSARRLTGLRCRLRFLEYRGVGPDRPFAGSSTSCTVEHRPMLHLAID